MCWLEGVTASAIRSTIDRRSSDPRARPPRPTPEPVTRPAAPEGPKPDALRGCDRSSTIRSSSMTSARSACNRLKSEGVTASVRRLSLPTTEALTLFLRRDPVSAARERRGHHRSKGSQLPLTAFDTDSRSSDPIRTADPICTAPPGTSAGARCVILSPTQVRGVTASVNGFDTDKRSSDPVPPCPSQPRVKSEGVTASVDGFRH